MNDQKLKPLDIFSSDMSIPFAVATYCRGHKFCLKTVGLFKALYERAEAQKRLEDAERGLLDADTRVTNAINAVKEKMGSDI